MMFSQVAVQSEVAARLSKSAKEGRSPHAQLFLGPEGSGNLALALAYAQYVHCQNPADDDSCGVCSSCKKHQSMMHPDMHFSFPFPSNQADVASELYPQWREACKKMPFMNYELWMKELDAENKQGNIPIKECRAIIKSLSLKPFEGGHKILLLWLPEFLGTEGNVLLKLIEEPPQDTLFLLVANNTEKILSTILSRTQLVRIPPIQPDAIADAMVKELQMSEDDARRIGLICGGNYLKAVELAQQTENAYLDDFRNWMGYCYQKNLPRALEWADEFAGNGREQLKGFFLYSITLLRAVMVFPYLKGNTGLSADEEAFAEKFSKVLDTHAKGELLFNWLNQATYEIERNGNPRLILTDLSFKVSRMLK